MIKINLLGDDTVIDTSGTWILIGFGVVISIVALTCVGLHLAITSSNEDLTIDRDRLQSQLDSLKEQTKEVQGLEEKRRELADKGAIIAILKRRKVGPVQVLDDINKALPPSAWITDIKESGGAMKMIGYALDNRVVSTFAKALEPSKFFETINIDSTKEETRKDGVKITQFTISAKINYAGKGVANPEQVLEASKPKAVENKKAAPKAGRSKGEDE